MSRYLLPKCQDCGNLIHDATRGDKKFCNATCRKRAERNRKRKQSSAQMLYNDAMGIISAFSMLPEKERGKGIEILKALRKSVDEQLRTLGDIEAKEKFAMLESFRKNR